MIHCRYSIDKLEFSFEINGEKKDRNWKKKKRKQVLKWWWKKDGGGPSTGQRRSISRPPPRRVPHPTQVLDSFQLASPLQINKKKRQNQIGLAKSFHLRIRWEVTHPKTAVELPIRV